MNVFFQPFMVGGAEWYVYNISKEMVKMGHEVHVFTANKCNGKTAPASETMEGIMVHRLPLKLDLTYRVKVWDGLGEALKEGSFDLIHAYDYAQPHSAVALAAAEKDNRASALTVFDVHSMIPRTWYKQYPMRLMEGYMARRTLPKAGRILVRAPPLIPPLVELGGDPQKIIVTPSGVRDESLQTFDGKEFLDKHGIQGSPLVLYLGRLNPLKGPQYLIQAAKDVLAAFPNAQFVFVGPDQSGYGEVLRSRSSALGIDAHVHFLGPIYDFQEKMEAYSACDVFALPTAFEGTSQAIFEAMAQGKPVVATNVGGIPSQITDGVEGFLVEHGDAKALASRLCQVLRDQSLAMEMGRRGRERVKEHRYSVLASKLASIYDSEVSGS